MIKLVRIDYRLIHGQVAFAWTRNLDANVILVANDKAATDEIVKMTLKLAKPPEVKLAIKTVDDAIKLLNGDKTKPYNVFVIVGNTLDALKLSKGVSEIKSINVGGLPEREGTWLISKALSIDNNDIKNFEEMESMGIELEVRQVPNEKRKDIQNLINKR